VRQLSSDSNTWPKRAGSGVFPISSAAVTTASCTRTPSMLGGIDLRGTVSTQAASGPAVSTLTAVPPTPAGIGTSGSLAAGRMQ
jgi:hypothetical protein